jgi:hypothetical protein
VLNRPEALKLRSNFIFPWSEERSRETPFGVRRDNFRTLRSRHSDRDARDGEALVVDDATVDGSCRLLGNPSTGSDEEERKDKWSEDGSHAIDSSIGKNTTSST